MKRPQIRQLTAEPGVAGDGDHRQDRAHSQQGQDEDLDLGGLLTLVARGDHRAFELVYEELAGPVYGVVRQVLRDPAQSEEVAQEVLLEVWRTATRFDPARGSAAAWAMTMAHRRAVDRVRSENAGARREQKSAPDLMQEEGDVADVVAATLDA